MFEKKCFRCGNRIKKGYDFCPFCGNNLRSVYEKEDYGLLGKNDFLNENFPGFGDSMMDKMVNGAFKMAEKIMEKQMKSLSEGMMDSAKTRPLIPDNLSNSPANMNFQFFVNGKRVFPPASNVQKFENRENPVKRVKINKMSNEKMERFGKLPKKEPNSKMRRLSGKIIYELEVPGVNNLDDVLISRLENSIEIRALGKDKVYSKILNLNLPILRYGLNKGNLILELAARN